MANENEIRPGVDKRGSGDMSKYDRPPFKPGTAKTEAPKKSDPQPKKEG